MSKSSTSSLTPFEQKPPPLDLNAVLGCQYGHYPWDDWHRWAMAEGLDKDLAFAGRLLIREAYQHGWDPWLQSLCGWHDDGQALLACALRFPKAADRQWDILMRTDGLRGDYHKRSTEWEYGYLKADARRLLASLAKQSSNGEGRLS